MVDALPLYDAPPHPLRPLQHRDFKGDVKQRFSRTRKPVKHYLVDFGLSKVYKPEDAPHLVGVVTALSPNSSKEVVLYVTPFPLMSIVWET